MYGVLFLCMAICVTASSLAKGAGSDVGNNSAPVKQSCTPTPQDSYDAQEGLEGNWDIKGRSKDGKRVSFRLIFYDGTDGLKEVFSNEMEMDESKKLDVKGDRFTAKFTIPDGSIAKDITIAGTFSGDNMRGTIATFKPKRSYTFAGTRVYVNIETTPR